MDTAIYILCFLFGFFTPMLLRLPTMQQLKRYLDKYLRRPKFKVRGNSLIVSNLYYRGVKCKLTVPFNSERACSDLNIVARAVVGSRSVDVTQLPGVPYLVTAREMGVEKIILCDTVSEEKQVFTGDKLPSFSRDGSVTPIEDEHMPDNIMTPKMAQTLHGLNKFFGEIQSKLETKTAWPIKAGEELVQTGEPSIE
jgi:hypothetical protein